MAQSIVIETLVKSRMKLLEEQKAMNSRYDDQVRELETAIERLSGKKVWEVEAETTYDDLNPDYIRSSQEEM